MKNMILATSILLCMLFGFLLGNLSIRSRVENLKKENSELRANLTEYYMEKSQLAVLRFDSSRSEAIIDSLIRIIDK